MGELAETCGDISRKYGIILLLQVNALNFCVGREARTYGLGLDLAKVELDAQSGKIIVDSSDATTASNIFAIGDAINVSHIMIVTCMQFTNEVLARHDCMHILS